MARLSENSSQLSLPYLPQPPPPQQNQAQSFIGTYVTFISNYDIRYDGIIYYINLQDSVLGLHNVKCYGTEGRIRKDGIQVPVSNRVCDYILFRINDIQLVKPRNGGLGRGDISSNKPSNTGKPPRPPSGSSSRKKVPLLANEKLENPQEHSCDFASLVNDNRLQIGYSNPYVQQPQLLGSDFYNPWSNNYLYPSTPCYIPYQAPLYWPQSYADWSYASAMMYPSSVFNTFSPTPTKDETKRYDPEIMRNVKQYNLWTRLGEEPPIKRAQNPYGPIARPVKRTNPYQETSDYSQCSPELQLAPSSYIGG